MARMGTSTRSTAEKHALIPTTTYYLSLHTTDPGTTGAHEISGGSYARQAITFGTPTNGKAKNKAKITFTGMPHKTIKYVGIWTASTSGTYKWGGAMTTDRTCPATSTLTFAATSITATIA